MITRKYPSARAVWSLLVIFCLTFWLLLALAVKSVAVPVAYVVDGDTVRLADSRYVRLIGIDTPEVGQCGYDAAKATLNRMIVNGTVRLVDPPAVENADHYGRLLRYVQEGKRDLGLALLRKGLARARYDSRDGYGWHPREERYRRADANNPNAC